MLTMMSVLIFNGIILSLDYYGISQEMELTLTNINTVLTFIYTFEIILKFIALGQKSFFRDSLNYIDSVVIILSLLDVLVSYGTSSIAAFRVIRIFRIFRVIRLIKLIRYFTFMRTLVFVISYSLPKFIYLALLLILINLIYALLGYQIFAGRFNPHEPLPRSNFENFGWAFLSVFQVLTLSGYSEVLYDVMDSSIGP